MSIRLLTILLLITVCGSVAQSQVYIFVRKDKNDFVFSYNVANGYCDALRKMSNKKEKQGGDWIPLHLSSEPGWVAVYGVASEKKNIEPHYFLSFGKETREEANNDARAQAAAFAAKVKDAAFILLSPILNKNKFPLEQPVPNMEKGTCKTEIVPPDKPLIPEKSENSTSIKTK